MANENTNTSTINHQPLSIRKGGKLPPKGIIPRKKDMEAENPNSNRWQKKKARIEELSNNIHRLRLNVSRDIQSDDEKVALTALVVAVMDRTAERIGNDDSANNGHFGVTGFRKKHITVVGSKVHLDYVGKSGTKHEKSFSDERIARAMKKGIKNSKGKFIFETSDGFRIKSDKVNRYLEPFKISAKDLRGYNANRWIIEKLKSQVSSSKPQISSEQPEKAKKERKKIFNKAVKETAIRVGHGSGTLKKHYMIPELPNEYINNARIIDMKNIGYYQEGGKIQNFTQFAVEKGYPSDYDTLFEAQLLGSRGLAGTVSKRSIKEQDERFHSMQIKNKQAHQEYNDAVLRGEIIDPEGKITMEKLKSWDYEAKKKEIDGKILQIDSYIRAIEGFGSMSHLPNGKLKLKYQRAVDEHLERKKNLLAELQAITMQEGGSTPSIEEKITERLQERQKTKEFKDTGIATYTRKYRAAYDIITLADLVDIEKDNVTAYKLIEKSKIWPLYNVNELKEQGNTSGAAYLKVKCRESLSSRPLDKKEAREVYVKNIEKLKAELEPLKTVQDVTKFLETFVDLDNFDLGDISFMNKSWFTESSYKGNLAKYSQREVEQYFDDIFGKKFYNFCRQKSDSARKTFAEAVLYQGYSKEQREQEVNSRYAQLQVRNKIYVSLIPKIEAAPDDRQELKKIMEVTGYYDILNKETILKWLNLRIQHTTLGKEEIEKNLSKGYTIREDDWSWSSAEKKEKVAITEEGEKPRVPQTIFEKYGVEQPKVLKRTPLNYIKRTGGLAVGDVSTKAVLENFGFKNIIYGNYVNDTESKEHTRHVLGAMLDLVEICNIDIKAINKMGGLDMNIGSTGCGAFSPAFACYFPELKAINITKKTGDGSIGHEWAHYLDNILADGSEHKATGIKWATENPVKSERVTMLFVEWNNWLMNGGEARKKKVVFYPQNKIRYTLHGNTVEEAVATVQKRYPLYSRYKEKTNGNVFKYYGWLAHKLNNNEPITVEMDTTATEFWAQSARWAPQTYFLNPQELFARAFQGWLEYKLKKSDRVNNYLVDIKSGMGLMAMIVPRNQWPYPYEEKELQWLNDWFERLFSAVRVDHGIKPFEWNTKERVDEYTDFKTTTNEKTDVGVIVTDKATIVEGGDTEEFEKGYAFRMEYMPDAKGENRTIYRLITNPYLQKRKATGGIRSEVFIFALKYFTDKKAGYGIADGLTDGLPNTMKTSGPLATIEEAKKEATEYFKEHKEKKSKPMIQESGYQPEIFSEGGKTKKAKSVGELASEYLNNWKSYMPRYLVEYNNGYSTVNDYGIAVSIAKKEGDSSIIDIKTKQTEFYSNGERMAEGGVTGMPSAPITWESIKTFFEGDLPAKVPAEKYKIDIRDQNDPAPFQSLNIKPIVFKTKSIDEPLKNIVGTDDLRQKLMGIYYDSAQKQKVATDANVLVVIKDESITETKLVDPFTGKAIDDRYPAYESVIPKENPFKIHLSKSQIEPLLYQLKGISRAKRFLKDDKYFVAKIVNPDVELVLNPDLFLRALIALMQYGATDFDIEFSAPNRAVMIIDSRNNGNKALVMPVMYGSNLIYVNVLDNIQAAPAIPAPVQSESPKEKGKKLRDTVMAMEGSADDKLHYLTQFENKYNLTEGFQKEADKIREDLITIREKEREAERASTMVIPAPTAKPAVITERRKKFSVHECASRLGRLGGLASAKARKKASKLEDGGDTDDFEVSKDSTEYLIDQELKPLIDKVRNIAIMPDYRHEFSDADILGIIVSKYNRWDGEKIKETCASAFEDANFRDAAEQISKFEEGGPTGECGCFLDYIETSKPALCERLMSEDMDSNHELKQQFDQAYEQWNGGKMNNADKISESKTNEMYSEVAQAWFLDNTLSEEKKLKEGKEIVQRYFDDNLYKAYTELIG